MELQQSLARENVLQFGKPRKLAQLTVNKKSLENEKKKFLNLMVNFIDSIDFEEKQDVQSVKKLLMCFRMKKNLESQANVHVGRTKILF